MVDTTDQADEAKRASEAAVGTDIRRQSGSASAVNRRGIAIIAAPIFDISGLCATLALVSTRDVLSVDANSNELRALRQTADEVTKELDGSRPALETHAGAGG